MLDVQWSREGLRGTLSNSSKGPGGKMPPCTAGEPPALLRDESGSSRGDLGLPVGIGDRGDRGGGNAQPGQEAGNPPPMTDDQGVGNSQFPANFAWTQAVCQMIQHGLFRRGKVPGKQRHNLSGTYPGENGIARIGFVWKAFAIFGTVPKIQLARAPFCGVNAATGGEVVLKVEFAALEVPTPGLPRAARLREP